MNMKNREIILDTPKKILDEENCDVKKCSCKSIVSLVMNITMCLKLKYRIKKFGKRVILHLSLPHFWVTGIILILSGTSIALSVMVKESNSFLSSVLGNIFAGLITGLVINVVSAIKAMSLYKTECLIRWLNSLLEDILVYKKMYRKLIHFKSYEEFKDEHILFDYLYDTMCCGENINVTISQGRFNDSLPFNSYEFIKRKFHYDAIIQTNENKELREIISEIDVSNITSKELRRLFYNMDRQLFILNGDVFKYVTHLEAKKKL